MRTYSNADSVLQVTLLIRDFLGLLQEEKNTVNSIGYVYFGEDINNLIILLLLSLSFGTVTDIDGNVYETVQIGDQLWMAENLKVTKYKDGSDIPNITNNDDWGGLSTGAYGDYDNNPEYSETYGRLYNWFTVDDDRGVCPEGWYIPSDGEFSALVDFLGGESVAGGKMKSTGTIEGGDGLWDYYSDEITEEATNESGFTGIPAGYRHSNYGSFYGMGDRDYFLSSSEYSSNSFWGRRLNYNVSSLSRSSYDRQGAYSIRCLQDVIEGCTNPNAINYDETANVDDGSCLENDCTDDATGAFAVFGGCFWVINDFGMCCDGNLAGTDVGLECPLSCNMCPGEFGNGTYDWYETLLVPSEYSTIQSAIDAASDGDSILVSAGTYYENIIIDKNIFVTGEDRETTIIDGGQNGSVVMLYHPCEPSSNVVIENFTIRNGNALKGGGLKFANSDAISRNLIISNNFADVVGGGVYISRGSPYLENIVISNNEASSGGGGIHITNDNVDDEETSPMLNNILITDNETSGWHAGAGIFLFQSNLEINYSTIANNIGHGGTVNDEFQESLGVGLYNWSGIVNINNSILWNNTYSEVYGFASYGSSYSIYLNYSDVQGGWEGEGNVDANPLFTDPDNGDFTLQANSPCIDAGDPESPLDPDGTIADMGAYPTYQGCTNTYATNYNFDATIDDGSCEYITDCIEVHAGANLISFPTIPNGFNDIPECIEGVIGEGIGAVNMDGTWIGSLTEFSCDEGYWFKSSENCAWCYDGMECLDDTMYTLHQGNNLISYPLSYCSEISEVLPDEIEDCIYAIAGEGVAAMNTLSGWIGALGLLCPWDGYWFVNTCDDIVFTFNQGTALARNTKVSTYPYKYHQSTQQAFYFIESVENINIGDWVLAYNGSDIIGAREWTGAMIDVPVMGYDGSNNTLGYIEHGKRPHFKLLQGTNLIDLYGEIPKWINNGIYIVTSLLEVQLIPSDFNLQAAYPNPFNPTTNISFELPVDSDVVVSIYNMNGREITSLLNGNMEAGYHSIVWEANTYASGLYFVKMVAGEYVNTQKLMLVK